MVNPSIFNFVVQLNFDLLFSGMERLDVDVMNGVMRIATGDVKAGTTGPNVIDERRRQEILLD
ncbi:hypothetical protein BDD12DRAFT_838854, partial [Trichophaea hybrida]